MEKNILIYADGTGQSSGVRFDERRSNIYKMYRATRCGPDSTVDPTKQFAYYDAGIGTLPPGLGFFGAIGKKIYNVVCQATGLGLTKNIVDCYAEVVRTWSPGDRIWLFGFSRGAYTVRCLGGVIALCGVPTRMKDGSPLKRDSATCQRIAREAVTKVYQHVSSPRDTAYLPQRAALAKRFRTEYSSGDSEHPNVYPHFVGVYDTVASLASWGSIFVAATLGVTALLVAGTIGWWLTGGFWIWVASLGALSTFLGTVFYLKTHLKVAFGLPEFHWLRTLHLTDFKMQFYDRTLNINVGWARHALAIDEWRRDFDRVSWGHPGEWRQVGRGEPPWFEQIWFAGNHSDIGGSYPEEQSRLSDIALGWMVAAAQSVPGNLQLDSSVLRTYPSALGMQHDETRSLAFRFAKKIDRKIHPEAIVHPTVYERFAATGVLHYDLERHYRPEGLRGHGKLSNHFEASVDAFTSNNPST
jgi:uncharacterized protein (DUF2235 family)